MSLGRSFGLITQRSQVQILTPLPTARPARVFPWPAFFVSPRFSPSYITSPTDSARNVFARTKRLSVGLIPPQAAPALLERAACCPPVSATRGQRRGLHLSRKVAGHEKSTTSRKGDSRTWYAGYVAAARRSMASRQGVAATFPNPVPQNEKGPRANGIPFLTSTLPVTKGLL